MKIKIIIQIIILSLLLYSCGTGIKDALQGKKRSEQGDEFLIDKKNPLSMPPDFDKLPEPGEEISALTNENKDNSEIKDLLITNKDDDSIDLSTKKKCDPNVKKCEITDIESSIIEKIK